MASSSLQEKIRRAATVPLRCAEGTAGLKLRRTDGQALTLVDGRLVLSVALDVFGEPLVEFFMGVKERGHNEVQQRPQLERNTEANHSESNENRKASLRL